MNVASLELSKELFSLCADLWPDAPIQIGYVWGKKTADSKEVLVKTSDMAGLYTWWFAFDLGYLFRKLPALLNQDGEIYQLTLLKGGVAKYQTYSLKKREFLDKFGMVGEQDEPENCMARLAIELFEHHILTKKEM